MDGGGGAICAVFVCGNKRNGGGVQIWRLPAAERVNKRERKTKRVSKNKISIYEKSDSFLRYRSVTLQMHETR